MNQALESLLTNAQLCFERGRLKMADLALQEIERRIDLGEAVLDDSFADRFFRLCELVPTAEQRETVESPAARKGRCAKCNGTGVFRKGTEYSRTCFACRGKGFQDDRDVALNERYWAFRRRLAAQSKQFQKSMDF